MDTTSAAVAIFGSTAILMAVATWLGWMRHRGRINELPAPLRGPGAIVVLIGVFVVALLVVLAVGLAS